MTLSHLTKAGMFNPTKGLTVKNINTTGIVTATSGSFSGNVTAVDGIFSGNVSIAGTLTYEDVTNVDSVGIITAQAGIQVGTGVTIESNGNSNFVGVSSLGTGATGAVYLYNPDADALSATTNDIYGWKAKTYTSGLQVNSFLYLSRSGSNGLTLGYNNATGSYITAQSGFLRLGVPYGGYFNIYSNQIWLKDRLQTTTFALFEKVSNSLWKSSLYSNNQVKLNIEPSGISVVGTTTTGQLAVTGISTFQDIDVDGHTELDNVNIVGVTTHNGQSKFYGNGNASITWGDTGYTGHLSFDGSNNAVIRAASGKALIFQTDHVNTRMTIGSQGNVSINNDLDVDGHTNLDNVSIAGVSTSTSGSFGPGILEESYMNDTGGGIVGNYNHDVLSYGMVWYGVTNAVGGWTFNIRGNSSTTFNSISSTNKVTTMTIYSANNNAANYMSAFNIDGVTQTVKWAGGSAPSVATGSGVDVYSMTIMKTGASTYHVFGNFTNFA